MRDSFAPAPGANALGQCTWSAHVVTSLGKPFNRLTISDIFIKIKFPHEFAGVRQGDLWRLALPQKGGDFYGRRIHIAFAPVGARYSLLDYGF